MMNFKKYITQTFETLKKRNLMMKIVFIIFFLSYLASCRACFNPIEGELYPVYQNHDIGDLYAYRTKHKDAKPCYLDGKKIFLERVEQDKSFLRSFFIGGEYFYVWRLLYQDDDSVMKPILTYKIPRRFGIGAVVQGTSFGIDDNKDSIIFVYAVDPYDGIKIEPSPYSDKIIVQKENSKRDASSCFCYMEWLN